MEYLCPLPIAITDNFRDWRRLVSLLSTSNCPICPINWSWRNAVCKLCRISAYGWEERTPRAECWCNHDVRAPPYCCSSPPRFWPDYDRHGESTHQRSSPENRTYSSLMSSATQQKQKHLEMKVLSREAQKVLTECGRQLKAAPFKDNGKFEFIEARATLKEASRDFVKMQSKVRACAISVIRSN